MSVKLRFVVIKGWAEFKAGDEYEVVDEVGIEHSKALFKLVELGFLMPMAYISPTSPADN